MAIQLFAMESVMLRAEKIHKDASAVKKQYLEDVVKVCTLDATENLVRAARKGAFYVADGEALDTILDGIQRLAKYRAAGLLNAKRSLANAALENEKYFF